MMQYLVTKLNNEEVVVEAERVEINEERNRVTFYGAGGDPVASFVGSNGFHPTADD
jgi:hypothetical protein